MNHLNKWNEKKNTSLTAHGTGFKEPRSLNLRQIRTALSGEVSWMLDNITATAGTNFANTDAIYNINWLNDENLSNYFRISSNCLQMNVDLIIVLACHTLFHFSKWIAVNISQIFIAFF